MTENHITTDLTDHLVSVLKKNNIPEDLYFVVLDFCLKHEASVTIRDGKIIIQAKKPNANN